MNLEMRNMNTTQRFPKINFRLVSIIAGSLLIGFAALSVDDAADRPQTKTETSAAKAKSAKKDESTAPKRDAKAALADFNALIGGWRGVGMPKRNSQVGAWGETAEWIWNFEKGVPTLHLHIEEGKQIDSAVLGWNEEKQIYHLHTVSADKTERDYTGKLADSKIVFDSEPDESGLIHRVTVTLLNPKRTIVLFEKRQKDSTFPTRIAEIGYTRQGTSLAIAGNDGPECIVTGGKGTMTVSYKGQTYYVCCSGCKQAFESDPEGTIADYKKRIAARAAAVKDQE